MASEAAVIAPVAAAEAASAAPVAAAEAASATAEAADAAASAAGAGAAAGGGGAGVSSFLPQADKATAANSEASTIDFFMCILSLLGPNQTGLSGALDGTIESPSIHQARNARACPVPAGNYSQRNNSP